MSAIITNSPHLIDESLVQLADACKHFPVKCSRQTLERWLRRGSRGVLLESVTIGSRRFTSIEAIARFLSAQASGQTGGHTPIVKCSHYAERMSEQEIGKKSQEYGRWSSAAGRF